MSKFTRITTNPAVMHGPEQLLGEFPFLEREGIIEALRYAAWQK